MCVVSPDALKNISEFGEANMFWYVKNVCVYHMLAYIMHCHAD